MTRAERALSPGGEDLVCKGLEETLTRCKSGHLLLYIILATFQQPLSLSTDTSHPYLATVWLSQHLVPCVYVLRPSLP